MARPHEYRRPCLFRQRSSQRLRPSATAKVVILLPKRDQAVVAPDWCGRRLSPRQRYRQTTRGALPLLADSPVTQAGLTRPVSTSWPESAVTRQRPPQSVLSSSAVLEISCRTAYRMGNVRTLGSHSATPSGATPRPF